LYRKSIFTLKGDLRCISSKHLADIDSLANGVKGSGKLSLPSGLLVIKKYNVMILKTAAEKLTNDNFDRIINSCGSYELEPNQMLLIEKAVFLPGNRLETDKDTIFLEMDQFPFPWMIRCFKEGDRFNPLGMSGRKKLKDLFIDKKIPNTARKTIPLFICRDDIFWVGGVQAAEKTRITEVSGNLLRLRLIPSSP
jgi:tRNA(Ile)-lysidine synthase